MLMNLTTGHLTDTEILPNCETRNRLPRAPTPHLIFEAPLYAGAVASLEDSEW